MGRGRRWAHSTARSPLDAPPLTLVLFYTLSRGASESQRENKVCEWEVIFKLIHEFQSVCKGIVWQEGSGSEFDQFILNLTSNREKIVK